MTERFHRAVMDPPGSPLEKYGNKTYPYILLGTAPHIHTAVIES